jgi:hypothetical protein
VLCAIGGNDVRALYHLFRCHLLSCSRFQVQVLVSALDASLHDGSLDELDAELYGKFLSPPFPAALTILATKLQQPLPILTRLDVF